MVDIKKDSNTLEEGVGTGLSDITAKSCTRGRSKLLWKNRPSTGGRNRISNDEKISKGQNVLIR